MLGSNSAWGVFTWESSPPLLSFFSPSHRPSLLSSSLISLIKDILCSPPAIALQQQIRQSARTHTSSAAGRWWAAGNGQAETDRITDGQRGTSTRLQMCEVHPHRHRLVIFFPPPSRTIKCAHSHTGCMRICTLAHTCKARWHAHES